MGLGAFGKEWTRDLYPEELKEIAAADKRWKESLRFNKEYEEYCKGYWEEMERIWNKEKEMTVYEVYIDGRLDLTCWGPGALWAAKWTHDQAVLHDCVAETRIKEDNKDESRV